MNRISVLAGTVLLLVFNAAKAQVIFPPGNLSCAVNVTYHFDQTPAQGNKSADDEKNTKLYLTQLPAKADILRVGKVLQANITWGDGKTSEVWQPGKLGLTFYRKSDDKKIISTRGNSNLPPVFNLDGDPSWTNWTGTDSFKGIVSFGGSQCNHYLKTITIPSKYEGARPVVTTYQLWTDTKTSLPLAFDDGTALYELKFKEAPGATISIPPEVQAEMKSYEDLLMPSARL